MLTNGTIVPSSLSVRDLQWQVDWDKDKCTLCGRCCAVCPVQAIELGVHRKRTIQIPSLAEIGPATASSNVYQVYHGIRQKTDPAYACTGCGMCNLVCPNGAIMGVRS
jgi:glutamate synthase (NADPH/NADH) large chain